MNKRNGLTIFVMVLSALYLLVTRFAVAADEDGGNDHLAVFEFGAAGEREITERTHHLGPAIGIEIEPIEDWLEMEFGASNYRSQGVTNWELELPFKKPFRLSSTIEVMPGLGPTWLHTTQPGVQSSTWGAEAVVDFFFWHSKRFGWYLELIYGVTFGNGNEKSVALTAGVFLAVP